VSGPTPRRLWRYVTRQLGLGSFLHSPGDGWKYPQIPAKTLLWAPLLGQLLRECSFHGIESLVRLSGCRTLLVNRTFSDDTLGYFTERLDAAPCREALAGVLRRAKRNKAFAGKAFIGLAVDGSTGCRRQQERKSCLCRGWKNKKERGRRLSPSPGLTVLLDDYRARKLAKAEGLQILGSVGLLEAFYLRRYLTDLRGVFRQFLVHNVYIDQRLVR
jgi:hypothetical protein